MRFVKDQKGSVLIIELVVLVLVAAAGGFTYYRVTQANKNAKIDVGSSVKHTVKPPPPPADPTAGWKTYTSLHEKLSFKYPPDWQPTTVLKSNEPGADSFAIKSPSGQVTVSWIAGIDGLGGACDPCPLQKVIQKQKLVGADLYYVAGVTIVDSQKARPWFALQDSKGILTDERNIGYLLFKGKNNNIVLNGQDFGVQFAGLVGGTLPYGGGFAEMTEAEAVKFLSNADALTAKQILLSAKY